MLVAAACSTAAGDVTELAPIRSWATDHLVNAVALSADGRYVVAAGSHGVVSIWDAREGTFLRYLRGTSDDSTSAAISPDNRIVAVTGIEGGAKTFDLATGMRRHSLENHGSRLMLCAFSPDGRLLATSCWDGEIRLWDVSDGRRIGSMEGCRVGLGGMAFMSKPPSIVAAWCKRLAELAEKPADKGPASSIGFAFGVQRSAIESGDLLWSRGTTVCPWAVAVDEESGRIAAGFEDGQVLVWPEKREKGVVWTLPKGGEVSRQPGIVAVAFLPDERVFAMAMSGEGGVWNAQSGERLARLSRPTDGLTSASVSRAAQTAAVATWGKQVELFDLRAR